LHFEVTGSGHVEVNLVTLRYRHNHYYTINISQPLFLMKISRTWAHNLLCVWSKRNNSALYSLHCKYTHI